MPSRPGMATSWLAHSAAASFEDESIARFTTSANSTRSTSVVNRRPPSTFRNAVSTSRAFHSPCGDVVIGPEVERELHRLPVPGPEHRLDVFFKADRLHQGEPFPVAF